MKIRVIIINFLIFFFLLLPLLMWIVWMLMPDRQLNILIVDKTVLTTEAREHRALNWVLTYKKYVKKNGELYKPAIDYLGFFPKENKKYIINDLKPLTEAEIDSISNYYDAVYYTDSYGIYYNEWYRDTLQTEHSEKVYGGLDDNDLLLITKMKEKSKLVIAEFNFLASPTNYRIRRALEDMFRFQWSGWTGRYFGSLDTVNNPELPHWVVRLYKLQHNNVWPFKKGGIVYCHEDSRVEVLEKDRDLIIEAPYINTFEFAQDKFGVPERLYYPYWFEISSTSDTNNKIFSYFQVVSNLRGDSILAHHNIPKIYPAAFEHTGGYPFYYFCGDFCDYPANFRFIKMKGIWYFHLFLLNQREPADGRPFYLRYYIPMMSVILNDYYQRLSRK